MKTITIKLRTVLFAVLTLLALVCFAPAGHAHQLQNAASPVTNELKESAQKERVAKPGQKKAKKQKAEKRAPRYTQASGCMDFLFIGWGH